MMKRFWLILITLLLSLSFVGGAMAKMNLTAVSASPGGSWYATMGAIAELVNKEVPEVNISAVPGSGVANPISVSTNEAQLGYAFPPFIMAARNAEGPYEGRPKAEDLRTIAGGFGSSPLQFAIRKDLAEKHGIENVSDLVKKKLPLRYVTNTPGTTDEYLGRMLLEFYGATYADIESWGGSVFMGGYTDHVQMMKDNHADVMINNINPPAGPFVEVALSVPLKILPIDEEGMKYMVEKQAHRPYVIPAGTYSEQEKDIQTATVLTTIIVNKDVPEEIVYKITKVLCDNVELVRSFAPATRIFDPETAWENLGAPLHPGAEKYYREKGYMQ